MVLSLRPLPRSAQQTSQVELAQGQVLPIFRPGGELADQLFPDRMGFPKLLFRPTKPPVPSLSRIPRLLWLLARIVSVQRHGWEIGCQLLEDRQGIAILLVRFRPLP